MNSLDTFRKRIRGEIAAVGHEIQSFNQQVEALTQRLDGLKCADELFDSDQTAVFELLQAAGTDGSNILRQAANVIPATLGQRAVSPKPSGG
jgi:hypothetical protein